MSRSCTVLSAEASARWRVRDGDPGGGSVMPQVAGGADAGGPGREDGVAGAEHAGDALAGFGDGGVVGAEQRGDVGPGHAEPVVADSGQQLRFQGVLEGGGRAGAGPAGVPAAQVEPLLAGGGAGQFEAGG